MRWRPELLLLKQVEPPASGVLVLEHDDGTATAIRVRLGHHSAREYEPGGEIALTVDLAMLGIIRSTEPDWRDGAAGRVLAVARREMPHWSDRF